MKQQKVFNWKYYSIHFVFWISSNDRKPTVRARQAFCFRSASRTSHFITSVSNSGKTDCHYTCGETVFFDDDLILYSFLQFIDVRDDRHQTLALGMISITLQVKSDAFQSVLFQINAGYGFVFFEQCSQIKGQNLLAEQVAFFAAR